MLYFALRMAAAAAETTQRRGNQRKAKAAAKRKRPAPLKFPAYGSGALITRPAPRAPELARLSLGLANVADADMTRQEKRNLKARTRQIKASPAARVRYLNA